MAHPRTAPPPPPTPETKTNARTKNCFEWNVGFETAKKVDESLVKVLCQIMGFFLAK